MHQYPDPAIWRLSVVAEIYSTEDEDVPDGTLSFEELRLEYVPRDQKSPSLPLENAFFICYHLNKKTPDALENRFLRLECGNLEEIEKLLRGHEEYYFTIEGSQLIPQTPIDIDIPCELPVVPYSVLAVSPRSTTPGAIYKIVKFEDKEYVYRSACLPQDVDNLAQEFRHYELLKGSKWIPKLGGKVCRQGRNEGALIQYFAKGDLRKQYQANEDVKKQWVKEIAAALLDFESRGFFYQDIRCANIVLSDDDSIRFINLGNTDAEEKWVHPDNLLSYTYSPYRGEFGRSLSSLWDPRLRDFKSPVEEKNPEVLRVTSISYPGESKGCLEFKDPRTPEQQRRYTVYGYGKLVWELFVGDEPISKEQLAKTPAWIQELVNGCCHESRYNCISEVLEYLRAVRG